MRDTLWPAAVLAATLCTSVYAGNADFNSPGDAADLQRLEGRAGRDGVCRRVVARYPAAGSLSKR